MLERSLIISFAAAVFALPGTVAAQSDPMRDCRKRVSVATNAAMPNINVRRDRDLDNGNYIILWDTLATSGSTITGLCEVDDSGRIVRFERSPPEKKGGKRGGMSRTDAELACKREARMRLSAGEVEVVTTFDRESGSTYYVQWRYDPREGRTAKGWCEIDSKKGQIRKFETGGG